MKICHCIKLDSCEQDAIKTTIHILEAVADDTMLSSAFDLENGIEISDILSWMYYVHKFITDYGS